MGYNVKNLKKDQYIDLETKDIILPLREEIEKNVQHTGENFEKCFAAYCEIKKAFGQPKPNSSCRTGCINSMNTILSNWFKLYDKQEPEAKEYNPFDELMKNNFATLKSMVIEDFGEDGYKSLNNGKRASKKMMVNKILGL